MVFKGCYHRFSFLTLGPARMLYKGPLSAPPIAPELKAKRERLTKVEEGRRRVRQKEAQRQRVEMREKLEISVRDELKDKSREIKGLLRNIGGTEDKMVATKVFLENMGYKANDRVAMRRFQRAVYGDLGLSKDKDARVDGWANPYFQVALANWYGMRVKWETNVNVEGNEALVKIVHELALPKNMDEGWKLYEWVCKQNGINPVKDQGNFGKVWINIDRLNMQSPDGATAWGRSLEDWIDIIAVSSLTDESVKALSIGPKVMEIRALLNADEKEKKETPYDEQKVHDDYKWILGDVLTPEQFETFFTTSKSELKRRIDMSKVYLPYKDAKKYLLGVLYVMERQGELEGLYETFKPKAPHLYNEAIIGAREYFPDELI